MTSPTGRKLIAEIGNDPDPSHAITINVGLRQPHVLVDSYATNDVDLTDIEQFPVAPSAAHPQEMTRGEVTVHFLAERRAAALAATPGPSRQALFSDAHKAGIAAQAQYRVDKGQSPVKSNTGTQEADGSTTATFRFENGSQEVLNVDSDGAITKVTPP